MGAPRRISVTGPHPDTPHVMVVLADAGGNVCLLFGCHRGADADVHQPTPATAAVVNVTLRVAAHAAEEEDPKRARCGNCGKPINGFSNGYDGKPLWRHNDGDSGCRLTAWPKRAPSDPHAPVVYPGVPSRTCIRGGCGRDLSDPVHDR